MSSIHFEYPLVFLLLLLFLICDRFCKLRSNSIIFPKIKFFSATGKVSNYNHILKWLTLITFVIALSSPYTISEQKRKPKNGLNIALVLDTSESMKLIGFSQGNRAVSRFGIVKKVVGDFILKRENDNLGLVVFGEYAFISSPLTYDKKILYTMLDNLQIGMAGKSTAIYDAIGQTISLLKNEENATNIAILITDGINTAGVIPREKAIELAKKRGIKIYTIGIGRMGEINPADLDDIAKATGGKFFLARSGEELEMIYNRIDQLEKRELKTPTIEIKNQLYFYPLLLSILFLTFYTTKKRELF